MKKLKSMLSVALSMAAGAGALTLGAPKTQAQSGGACQIDNTFCDSMNGDTCHYAKDFTCQITDQGNGSFSCISTWCGSIPNG